jgi:putrescine transport system substrate-binding protein
VSFPSVPKSTAGQKNRCHGQSAGGAALAQDRVVNVYNWSDYIDESILEDFTKETGIKVVYDVFDSNEVLETKLLAGSAPATTSWCRPAPSSPTRSRPACSRSSTSPSCRTCQHVEGFRARVEKYDPGNEYAINYMWGTTGIGIQCRQGQGGARRGRPVNTWDLSVRQGNRKSSRIAASSCSTRRPNDPGRAELSRALDPDSKDQESTSKRPRSC